MRIRSVHLKYRDSKAGSPWRESLLAKKNKTDIKIILHSIGSKNQKIHFTVLINTRMKYLRKRKEEIIPSFFQGY
jgi:hypothetical protein